jgi:hypothetical protein
MLVSYCRQCLQDTQEKVVVAYGMLRKDIDIPHDIHQTPPIRNGSFGIPPKQVRDMTGWDTIFVEGDDPQTKANIVTNYGDQFE